MDKEALFAPRAATNSGMPEGTVEVPGVGVVTVRGLTRYEVMLMRKATDTENVGGDRALAIEQKMLAMALVDPADVTEQDIALWQQASLAGELEPVVQRVQELSGMVADATKSRSETARQ